eukprot:gene24469-10073_t
MPPAPPRVVKPPSAPKPRGEVAELSVSLQNLCTSGNRSDKEWKSAKREVFSSDDVVLKKMLYLYITTYATQIPDLALLGINQLLKDCNDQDPTTTPVNHGLEDRHPYVRRTAAMGVLKMYHIDPDIVIRHGMLDRVRQMLLTDADPQVVANCLTVLMQTEPDVKALASKSLVYNLVNRLKEFSDWSQCQVLELASYYMPASEAEKRLLHTITTEFSDWSQCQEFSDWSQCQVLELASYYTPSSEAEVYDLLNVLEDRMGHANSAVVMAAIRVFLLFTLNMTATHQQVLERVKEPLKTLASSVDPTLAYPCTVTYIHHCLFHYQVLERVKEPLKTLASHDDPTLAYPCTVTYIHHCLFHYQVLERVKEPLKTLASRDDPTLAYPALSHALIVAQRAPTILDRDHISFYCRTHDPWYIKKIKMEVLAAIASSNNVYEIVSELTEIKLEVLAAIASSNNVYEIKMEKGVLAAIASSNNECEIVSELAE